MGLWAWGFGHWAWGVGHGAWGFGAAHHPRPSHPPTPLHPPHHPHPPTTQTLHSSILFERSTTPAAAPTGPGAVETRRVQVTLYKATASTTLGISLAAPVSTVAVNEAAVQPSVA